MFFASSVKNTLFAVVCAALLPAVCIIVFSGMEDRSRKEATVMEEAKELVSGIAFKKQSVTENTRALLIAMSRFDEITRMDIPAIRTIFRAVVQRTPFYSDLALVSPQGTVLASTLSPAGSPSLDASHIERALVLNRFYVGESYYNEKEKLAHLRFAYPVHGEDGRLRCMIVGGVRTDNYAFAAYEKDMPQGARLRLLDGRGRVFFSFPGSEVTQDNAPGVWERMRERGDREGAMSYVLLSGEIRTIVYRHLYLADNDVPYMTVALSLPDSAGYAQGTQALSRNLGFLACAAFLTLGLVGWLGTSAVTRPLMAVLAAARRLRQGDYSARADMPALQGEFGTLAKRFNSMAEAIERRDRERIQAKTLSDANNAAKSEFLAAMSHAIRTPMNSVIGIAYLLMKTRLTPQQHGYVNRIYTSASTLLGIINDILDFSNIESGHFTMEWAPFRLSDTLDNIMNLYGHKVAERKLTLTLDVAEDVPDALYGDPLRLGQVLGNLIGNAVKFTEQGGITIRCIPVRAIGEEASCDLSLPGSGPSSGGENVRLLFSVEDTGIGMTGSQVESLFNAYVQADDSISRKYGGTGLGLAISHRLVQLMGGDIRVESVFGKGTTMIFSACFGRQADEKAAPEQNGRSRASDAPSPGVTPDPHSASPGRDSPRMLEAMHVLLVEDNPINQEIAAELLRDVGARVSLASNGEEALETLTGNKPLPPVDLVLMDVQMPVMDGYEATGHIRAMEAFKTLPIIAMTAHAMNEERDRCLAAGMDGHISKPIEIDKFFATIESCMHSARQENSSR